jgi:hypothetical protein
MPAVGPEVGCLTWKRLLEVEVEVEVLAMLLELATDQAMRWTMIELPNPFVEIVHRLEKMTPTVMTLLMWVRYQCHLLWDCVCVWYRSIENQRLCNKQQPNNKSLLDWLDIHCSALSRSLYSCSIAASNGSDDLEAVFGKCNRLRIDWNIDIEERMSNQILQCGNLWVGKEDGIQNLHRIDAHQSLEHQQYAPTCVPALPTCRSIPWQSLLGMLQGAW